MPKRFTLAQINTCLSDNGWNILQEDSNFIIYQTNHHPGGDVYVPTSIGYYEWEYICRQLEDQSIDPEPLHECFSSLPE